MELDKEKMIDLLNGIIEHLQMHEGSGLKSMMDSKKKPMDDPEGLSISKVSVLPGKDPEEKDDEKMAPEMAPEMGSKEGMPGMPNEDEMSDDELQELIKKHLA